MFVASHKTLAFGLPLISTVFAGDVNLAAYSAPIMLLFPLQLIIGSLLVPQLEIYTAKL
jgi:sodium/bile acid cotransporter 7